MSPIPGEKVEDGSGLPEEARDLLDKIFFRPVTWQSAFDETIERLIQMIKLGPVPPGTQLPSERELVIRLGVSRTTLREAIRALQHQGLLETRRGRSGGTFVSGPEDPIPSKDEAIRMARSMQDEIVHALDLRSAVEPKVAELAAMRASEEEIELLFVLQERSARATASEVRPTDSALHISIAYVASSEYLLHSVLTVQTKLHDLLAFIGVVPTDRLEARASSRQHEKIVRAIANRDPARAFQAMTQHVAGTAELFQEVLECPPERFVAPSPKRASRSKTS